MRCRVMLYFQAPAMRIGTDMAALFCKGLAKHRLAHKGLAGCCLHQRSGELVGSIVALLHTMSYDLRV
jgi:hypothetical protein